jgi:integrase
VKRIRGRLLYFGPMTPDGDHGAQAALEKWLSQKDDLLAGRTPRASGGGVTIREMLNRFLTAKDTLVVSGEIRAATFAEYHKVAERLAAVFGLWRAVEDLRSEDFERLRQRLAKQYSPVRLGNEVQKVRTIFKYAYESGLIDRPVRFGPAFKKPSAKVLRLERAKKGLRLFDPDELRALLNAADMSMKAKILLGVNCGFGNTDAANLRISALDLAGGWVDYPRPKTGIPRRCPLWPETVVALRDYLATRPTPRDPAHNDLVFIGRRGKTMLGKHDHWRVATDFGKLLRNTKVKAGDGEKILYRPGLSFYTLRHVLQTIGDGARDPVALRELMGHAPPANDMAALYRERIDDARLQAVVAHVRQWLFGSKTK